MDARLLQTAAERLDPRPHPPSATAAAAAAAADKNTVLQLWKALHDLTVAGLFARAGAALGPTDIDCAWKELSKGGARAVQFDSVKALVASRLAQIGCEWRLTEGSPVRDLLASFCWLIAQCEVLEQHVNTLCVEATRTGPFLDLQGSRVWVAPAVASPEGVPVGRQTVASTSAAVFLASRNCGSLWHAARELAAAEEQRTLVLRKLAQVQHTVRAQGSRMLSPLEVSVGITRPESAATARAELNERIAKLRRARAAHDHALAFWKWCRTTLRPDGTTTSVAPQAESGVRRLRRHHATRAGTPRQRLADLHVDRLIRDMGLEIRGARAAVPT